MASGKKNYFRHSMNAFEDDKIQNAIDILGYEGYAYYFILIEMLAKQCENEFKNPIRIHRQSLRNVWRKQTKSCNKVVEKLQESGLFVATFNGNFIEFDIPNLSKYLGKYTTKSSPNTPNKSKEKKSKVKEKKAPKTKFDIDLIYAAYPLKKGKQKGLDKLKTIVKTQEQFDLILEASKQYAASRKNEDSSYTKHFSSWVNAASWNDEIEESTEDYAKRILREMEEANNVQQS